MAIATSPLTDSLSANAPGIHQEFQELKARATQILTDMSRIVQSVNQNEHNTHQNFDTAIRSLKSDLDRRDEKRDRLLAKTVQLAMTHAQAIIGKIGKDLMEPSEGEGEHITLEAPPLAIVTPPRESPSSMASQQHLQSLSQVVHEEPDHPGSNSDSGPDSDTDPEAEESKGKNCQIERRLALAVVKANIAKAGSINLYHKTLPKGAPKKYKGQKKD
ncbi:hypothetical protein BGZ65_011564 [Modicella reniformis]|uniref:Uncharacterized protein n=1 Tax=Modicella reniformis TaxID=1440133 RepID=A0A9P6MDA2_9FUNG|nr:hypothetical protein BGZ65_011564 [Modicella reniformis]